MRVFWKRREREILGGSSRSSATLAEPLKALQPLAETIELARGTSRAASISRVAEELRRRGEEIVELFKEVNSPAGRAVFPIHLRRGAEDVFVEVESSPWDERITRGALRSAAVLRGSQYSRALFEVLSAYPVPEEVRYFCGRSSAALFQLDLLHYDDPKDPQVSAEAFMITARRHWGLDLDYDPEKLPLIEELLLAALDEEPESGGRAPILDALVRGLGCYVGEILRRHATLQGSWRSTADWGEHLVIEFPDATADPIGKARAFLENGPDDSVAYYVAYALKELNA